MIERKRGHIVAISSLAGLLGLPRAISYCATKYGVRGFMNALYVELCADQNEKIVNLTTVFPCFISTRKEIDFVFKSFGYGCHQKL
jgi:all-trans-retinol dehydrogenase (NAD+)